MTDAIVRTLVRLFIRRRRLLEWVTAAQSKVHVRSDVARMVSMDGRRGRPRGWRRGHRGAHGAGIVADRRAVPDPLGGVACCRAMGEPAACTGPAPRRSPTRTPAPCDSSHAGHGGSSRRSSRTRITTCRPITSRKIRSRSSPIGRRPPISGSICCRSSPPAISDGSARTTRSIVSSATLAAMDSLERCHGHFYNWYDTHDLRPLEPKYVSSVDSGNLAGHLIAAGTSLSADDRRPGVAPRWLDGIDDGLQLTRESLRLLADDRRTHTVARKHLEEALDALAGRCRRIAGRLASPISTS